MPNGRWIRTCVAIAALAVAIALVPQSAQAATKQCRVPSPSGESGLTVTGSHATVLPCSQWQYLIGLAMERGGGMVPLRIGSCGTACAIYKRFKCSVGSPTAANGY